MSTDKCLYKEEVTKLNEPLLTDFEMEQLRAVTYVLWAAHITDSAAQDPHVASGVCFLRREISSSEMKLCEEHDEFVWMKVAKLL